MPAAATGDLYAESSAVLAWLLGEPSGRDARRLLATARRVVTSDLTLVECERALIRAEVLGEISPARHAELTGVLRAAAVHWDMLTLHEEVLARSRQPFPNEPIRTLDAIHLASALVARTATRSLSVLSLDDKIRKTAKSLGLPVVPA
jgi:predicted nucleic acid-binding protein